MTELMQRARFAAPVDRSTVTADWRRRGFSCHSFADPPGREWNDFVHDTNELVTVIEGHLHLIMNGETHALGPGDEAFIGRGVRHSVHNVHGTTTRWLFGYD